MSATGTLAKPRCAACGTTTADYYVSATISEPGFSQTYKKQCHRCFAALLDRINAVFQSSDDPLPAENQP